MSLLRGLPPAIGDGMRVLVLGSMPGEASLRQQQYYGHPRNRFWPLMEALFGVDAGLPYPQRIAALHAAGVGLWDVLGACVRRGSLDSAIERDSEIANPIAALCARSPGLRAIALNGGKAAQAFARHVEPQLDAALARRLSIHRLPSTSPANASYALAQLQAAWSAVTAARSGE
ncbi:DNA-deoxyinosine glycosylase [Luteimonas sp. SX5]|uniref:DNA-deoxyinosine glycosylase n=1 Tax=Luteimonas galliterrae TaxID=2940486 RepID=A0ABT0MN17_9GAMM|nr:DNA-deoxyinosine glycosylase [Luteimonas galliterrae]MCL1635644.1 DNA-deoxyinosine glycosylase [Luteimonas galliterrae]